jgi:amino acid adenylation domain-containing protein
MVKMDAGVRLLVRQVKSSGLLAVEEDGAEEDAREEHEQAAAGARVADVGRRVRPQNLAYVIYTSGSTGRPKGVMIEHRSIINFINCLQEAIYEKHADIRRVGLNASLGFDASVQQIMRLLRGDTIFILQKEKKLDAEGLLNYLDEKDIEVLDCTPSQLRLLLQAGMEAEERRMPRVVLVGGEAIDPNIWEEITRSKNRDYYNVYGPTESTVDSTVCAVNGSPAPTIGRPLSNIEVKILSREGASAPIGVAGEVCIAGRGLARGYMSRADQTAEKFIADPYGGECGQRMYRTGDLGRYLPDGRIEYLGRIDHQVKVRGFRIELGEIEAVINQHEKVSESAVVVREDQTRGRRLVAYVAPKGGEEISWAEMRQYLGERLPDYMAPGTYVRMEKLPLTINGKVDRSALPEEAAESGSEEYEEPRTISEQMIAGIWSEVLGLERVSRKDNFFWVGGHSLIGAQVISRVRERLGVEIGVRSLFEKPTLEEFAREVEERMREGRSGRMPVIERRKRKGAERLSYEQEGLWFIDQLQPGSATYNIPTYLRISGELHILALEQGLSEVARRHETLRTTFSISNGEPVQVIGAAELIKLPIVDLSGLQVSERAAMARELARVEGQRPFDLARGPVIRQRIVREDHQQHNILVTMHHILSDAWSMQVFDQEIKAIYERYVKGESSALGELKIQYADYAAWQREWMQGAVLERGLRYWREKLAGAPPALELAMDRARPAAQTSKAAYRSVRLTGDLTRRIKDLSRKEGTTLYMTLLAGFKMLLGKWANGQDIVVGTPTAGRNSVEIERLIGYFVKTIALRTSLGGDPSLGDVMRRVREVVLEAYAHQDVPFEKLVEELQPERSLGHSPLFQVMFVLQTVEAGFGEKGETDYVEDSEGGGTAKFDLTLALREESEEIRGAIEYNAEIFDGTTVERLARHWVRALDALAADRGRRLSQLELMSEAERHQMVVEWNDTHQGWGEESSVDELFARQAELRPDAIAVVDGWRSVSYGEVERRANEVARSLIIAGVEEEAWVGLRAGRSVEAVIGMLGIIKAGCAYVPMGESNPAGRVEAMRRDAGVRLVVTYEERSGRLVIEEDGAERGVREEDEGARAGDVVGDVVRRARPQNLAYVIFTSGSTGRPKGVGVTHEGLVNLVRWHQWAYGVKPGDRTTQVASLSFDASIWEVWANLSCGASLYIVGEEERMDPSELKSWLISNGINMSFLPTPMAERLMMMRWPEKGELRALLTGGDLLQQHKPDGVSYEVVNNYGPTESAVVATWGSVGSRGAGERLPSIGRPISNTRVYVLDESQGVAPIGVTGELCITGRGLARGYPRMADQTAEKFIADPYVEESGQRMYRTGDLGKYLPDGRIEFLGRVDHQVKVRGFRIELGEIEAVIKGHEKVRESVVVAREDKAGGKRLVAYVAPEKGEEIGWGELRRYLSERLPEYMIPSAYVRMEEMPLTANGKVDRRALPPGDGINVDHSDSFVAPRNDLEKRLAHIWESVLGVQPIGVRDNFFEVGGHSILAPRLMARIEQELGQKLALSTLFQGATIERLAELLRTPSQTERFSPLVSLQSRGSRRPFFCVHPAGGFVSCYTSLAAHIGTDRPFYGLQSKGVGSGRPAFFRIEDMASYYLEALRNAQPEGPYLIGGWSLGGIIAFEMARQLSMQGREVALLALIDSRLPSRSHTRLDDSGLLYSFAYDFGIPYNRLTLPEDVLREFSPGERLAYVLSKGKEVDAAPRDMSSTEFHNLFEIFKANVQAMFEYTPGKYAGRVTLLQSQEEIDRQPSYPARLFRKISPLKRRRLRASSLEASVEWEQWATGGVDVLEAPGDHYSMVREPKVRILAEKLRACMDRAEERKRT